MASGLRAAVLAALGWWIYAPALYGDWVWDDVLYLPQNPLLNDPERLWKLWFAPGHVLDYYPIEATVQWVQWQLWGQNTFGYHVTNVALHIVNALLVWRLLGKFKLRLAWLGGLLFLVHPVQVESVAYISELKNTLSLSPFLLAMGAWIDYEERQQTRDYALALGLFLVAMLCKISMAPFPVVILLYAWWKRGRVGTQDLKQSAPFFLISLALGVMTILSGIWYRQLHLEPEEIVPLGGLALRDWPARACRSPSISRSFSGPGKRSRCIPSGRSTLHRRCSLCRGFSGAPSPAGSGLNAGVGDAMPCSGSASSPS